MISTQSLEVSGGVTVDVDCLFTDSFAPNNHHLYYGYSSVLSSKNMYMTDPIPKYMLENINADYDSRNGEYTYYNLLYKNLATPKDIEFKLVQTLSNSSLSYLMLHHMLEDSYLKSIDIDIYLSEIASINIDSSGSDGAIIDNCVVSDYINLTIHHTDNWVYLYKLKILNKVRCKDINIRIEYFMEPLGDRVSLITMPGPNTFTYDEYNYITMHIYLQDISEDAYFTVIDFDTTYDDEDTVTDMNLIVYLETPNLDNGCMLLSDFGCIFRNKTLKTKWKSVSIHMSPDMSSIDIGGTAGFTDNFTYAFDYIK